MNKNDSLNRSDLAITLNILGYYHCADNSDHWVPGIAKSWESILLAMWYRETVIVFDEDRFWLQVYRYRFPVEHDMMQYIFLFHQKRSVCERARILNSFDAGDRILRFWGSIKCLLGKTENMCCCSRGSFIYSDRAKSKIRFKMWTNVLSSLK